MGEVAGRDRPVARLRQLLAQGQDLRVRLLQHVLVRQARHGLGGPDGLEEGGGAGLQERAGFIIIMGVLIAGEAGGGGGKSYCGIVGLFEMSFLIYEILIVRFMKSTSFAQRTKASEYIRVLPTVCDVTIYHNALSYKDTLETSSVTARPENTPLKWQYRHLRIGV